MLYLLAFIGVWAILHYTSQKLIQFGTWCESVSVELLKDNQKKELNKIRKQIPSIEDTYIKDVRQEIDTLIN